MSRPRVPSLWRGRSNQFRVGLVLMMLFALVMCGLVTKTRIQTALRGGDVVSADFVENYDISAGKTKVKQGGVEVGIVSGVDRSHGRTRVTMKVDHDAFVLLGSAPSARIEPLTILGGNYAINLQPGGSGTLRENAVIPTERTTTPVELDRVLEALPSSTRAALQDLVGTAAVDLDGARAEIKRLVDVAPRTLSGGAAVFGALRGTRPEKDLTDVVRYVQRASAALDTQDDELAGSLDGLANVSTTLAENREALARALDVLPATLDQTDAGLRDLDTTLGLLDETAHAARPAVRELGPLAKQLDPALVEARPVLADLRPLLQDAAPLVRRLAPAASSAKAVLSDVRGPVLDRVRGPILDTLGSTWRGQGPYKLSGGGVQADHKMYEELGYMLSNIDRASQTRDSNGGALLGFQVSGGPGSLAPFSFDDWLRQMFHLPIAGGRR